jgi:hypothetical protein
MKLAVQVPAIERRLNINSSPQIASKPDMGNIVPSVCLGVTCGTGRCPPNYYCLNQVCYPSGGGGW